MTEKVNYTLETEEEKEFSDEFKRVLINIGMFGVGCGLYGFAIGKKFGYKRGFRDGKSYTNNKFMELKNHMIKTLKESEWE